MPLVESDEPAVLLNLCLCQATITDNRGNRGCGSSNHAMPLFVSLLMLLLTLYSTGFFFVFFLKQFTRDALITLSGAREKGRDFVYFTDVKRIPSTDLATIERLWNKFSGGKFGYSVQKVSFIESCACVSLVCDAKMDCSRNF